MKINWALRFKNKATLTAIILAFIALVYQVLGIFDIVPKISESDVTNIVGMVINILVMVGVVIDPTTEGVNDSDQAMLYKTPGKME